MNRVTLHLDITVTAHEAHLLKQTLVDAFAEFLSLRCTEVHRAEYGDGSVEYFPNRGAETYVAKRYATRSAEWQQNKVLEVQQRCRLAAILKHAAFHVEVE
jgi:hypothetical protein